MSLTWNSADVVSAIGLQEGWGSFKWVSTVPPIFFIFGFKIYINRTFLPQFRWYIPNADELHMAKIHSERADRRGGRLEKRFGHPALNAELFTPMLHAKMMPLLPEVYHGRLKSEETTVDEYGGQKMEASVIPGGIKIAGVQQSELEYDPVLYQRDRGEADWDQRSISSSTALMDEAGGMVHSKSGSGLFGGDQQQQQQYHPGHTAKKPSGYNAYLAHGPAHEFEMSRLDGRQTDQLPLLSDASPSPVQAPARTGYFDPRYGQHPAASNVTLVAPGGGGGVVGSQYGGSQASLPAYRSEFGRSSPQLSYAHQQQQQQHQQQQYQQQQHQQQYRGHSPTQTPQYNANRQAAGTPQHYSPVSASPGPGSPSPQYPPGVYPQFPPGSQQGYVGEREAAVHRPSRPPSAGAGATLGGAGAGDWNVSPNTNPSGNFAGRGAGRRY